MLASDAVHPVVDARPILPISDNSLWNIAAARRDGIASDIEAQLESLNLKGWVRKSQPGEYPLYVAVDIWRPLSSHEISETFDRSHLKITIEVEPYREHPIIFTSELKRGNREHKASYWELSSPELQEMVRFLVEGGSKPSFFKSRIPLIVRIISSFVPIPLRRYENRLIKEARTGKLTFPLLIGAAGAIASLVGIVNAIEASSKYYRSGDVLPFSLVAVFGLALMALAAWLSARRPILHAVAKQPERSPRREYMVDSWQVSVPDAGQDFEAFQQRINGALRQMDPSLEFSFETHQSLTPRGFEARDRLVITKGQGNVHVHIQPFGRDAFVGWDSYLNWARWSETKPVSTVVRQGKRVEYRSLTAGVHVPSKFDLMELGALAETTHRNIVREIKAFLKEKEIEADLDFRIIRGDRSRALSEGKEKDSKDIGETAS